MRPEEEQLEPVSVGLDQLADDGHLREISLT